MRGMPIIWNVNGWRPSISRTMMSRWKNHRHLIQMNEVLSRTCSGLWKVQPILFSMNNQALWRLSKRLAKAWSIGKELLVIDCDREASVLHASWESHEVFNRSMDDCRLIRWHERSWAACDREIVPLWNLWCNWALLVFFCKVSVFPSHLRCVVQLCLWGAAFRAVSFPACRLAFTGDGMVEAVVAQQCSRWLVVVDGLLWIRSSRFWTLLFSLFSSPRTSHSIIFHMCG